VRDGNLQRSAGYAAWASGRWLDGGRMGGGATSSCAAPGNCPMGTLSIACTSAANCTNGGVCCLSDLRRWRVGGFPGGFGMGANGRRRGPDGDPARARAPAASKTLSIERPNAMAAPACLRLEGRRARWWRRHGGFCQKRGWRRGLRLPGGFGMGGADGGFGGFPPAEALVCLRAGRVIDGWRR